MTITPDRTHSPHPTRRDGETKSAFVAAWAVGHEVKALGEVGGLTLGPDDPDGTAWVIAAVTGVVDDVADIITPGAFARTLSTRQIKGCAGHDWQRQTAIQRAAIELMPGDPRLPSHVLAPDNSQIPWPAEAGALAVKASYILDSTEGRDAWARHRAARGQQAYSIGYKVVPDRTYVRSDGVRVIGDLDVYEFSDVLHGAHPLARGVDVKAADHDGIETKARRRGGSSGGGDGLRRVQDSDYWGYPVGTPIVGNMKPRGRKARLRRRKGQPAPATLGTTTAAPKKAPKEAARGPVPVNRRVSRAPAKDTTVRGDSLDDDAPGLFAEPEREARLRAARRATGDIDTHLDNLANEGADVDVRESPSVRKLLREGATPADVREGLSERLGVDLDRRDDERFGRSDDNADLRELLADYEEEYDTARRDQSIGDRPGARDDDDPDIEEGLNAVDDYWENDGGETPDDVDALLDAAERSADLGDDAGAAALIERAAYAESTEGEDITRNRRLAKLRQQVSAVAAEKTGLTDPGERRVLADLARGTGEVDDNTLRMTLEEAALIERGGGDRPDVAAAIADLRNASPDERVDAIRDLSRARRGDRGVYAGDLENGPLDADALTDASDGEDNLTAGGALRVTALNVGVGLDGGRQDQDAALANARALARQNGVSERDLADELDRLNRTTEDNPNRPDEFDMLGDIAGALRGSDPDGGRGDGDSDGDDGAPSAPAAPRRADEPATTGGLTPEQVELARRADELVRRGMTPENSPELADIVDRFQRTGQRDQLDVPDPADPVALRATSLSRIQDRRELAAAAAALSEQELEDVADEFFARAGQLGKPGRRSRAHEAVIQAIDDKKRARRPEMDGRASNAFRAMRTGDDRDRAQAMGSLSNEQLESVRDFARWDFDTNDNERSHDVADVATAELDRRESGEGIDPRAAAGRRAVEGARTMGDLRRAMGSMDDDELGLVVASLDDEARAVGALAVDGRGVPGAKISKRHGELRRERDRRADSALAKQNTAGRAAALGQMDADQLSELASRNRAELIKLQEGRRIADRPEVTRRNRLDESIRKAQLDLARAEGDGPEEFTGRNVLAMISGENMDTGEVAENFGVTKPQALRMLNRLERDGYLTRNSGNNEGTSVSGGRRAIEDLGWESINGRDADPAELLARYDQNNPGEAPGSGGPDDADTTGLPGGIDPADPEPFGSATDEAPQRSAEEVATAYEDAVDALNNGETDALADALVQMGVPASDNPDDLADALITMPPGVASERLAAIRDDVGPDRETRLADARAAATAAAALPPPSSENVIAVEARVSWAPTDRRTWLESLTDDEFDDVAAAMPEVEQRAVDFDEATRPQGGAPRRLRDVTAMRDAVIAEQERRDAGGEQGAPGPAQGGDSEPPADGVRISPEDLAAAGSVGDDDSDGSSDGSGGGDLPPADVFPGDSADTGDASAPGDADAPDAAGEEMPPGSAPDDAAPDPDAPEAPGTANATGGPTERIEADEVAAALDDAAADSMGLTEAPDGELEVDNDIADRQDLVERLVDQDDAGELDLGAADDESLGSMRRSLVAELALQQEIRRRDRRRSATTDPATTTGSDGGGGTAGDSEGGSSSVATGGSTAADTPTVRVRPGTAGAADDLADALDSGDADAIAVARARLESSLRRSRDTSPEMEALREALAEGRTPDAEQLRELAGAVRAATRARRSERARTRRTAKRIERERIRSLLGKVNNEMSTRGMNPEEYGGPVPADTPDLDTTTPGAPAGPPGSRTNPRGAAPATGTQAQRDTQRAERINPITGRRDDTTAPPIPATPAVRVESSVETLRARLRDMMTAQGGDAAAKLDEYQWDTAVISEGGNLYAVKSNKRGGWEVMHASGAKFSAASVSAKGLGNADMATLINAMERAEVGPPGNRRQIDWIGGGPDVSERLRALDKESRDGGGPDVLADLLDQGSSDVAARNIAAGRLDARAVTAMADSRRSSNTGGSGGPNGAAQASHIVDNTLEALGQRIGYGRAGRRYAESRSAEQVETDKLTERVRLSASNMYALGSPDRAIALLEQRADALADREDADDRGTAALRSAAQAIRVQYADRPILPAAHRRAMAPGDRFAMATGPDGTPEVWTFEGTSGGDTYSSRGGMLITGPDGQSRRYATGTGGGMRTGQLEPDGHDGPRPRDSKMLPLAPGEAPPASFDDFAAAHDQYVLDAFGADKEAAVSDWKARGTGLSTTRAASRPASGTPRARRTSTRRSGPAVAPIPQEQELAETSAANRRAVLGRFADRVSFSEQPVVQREKDLDAVLRDWSAATGDSKLAAQKRALGGQSERFSKRGVQFSDGGTFLVEPDGTVNHVPTGMTLGRLTTGMSRDHAMRMANMFERLHVDGSPLDWDDDVSPRALLQLREAQQIGADGDEPHLISRLRLHSALGDGATSTDWINEQTNNRGAVAAVALRSNAPNPDAADAAAGLMADVRLLKPTTGDRSAGSRYGSKSDETVARRVAKAAEDAQYLATVDPHRAAQILAEAIGRDGETTLSPVETRKFGGYSAETAKPDPVKVADLLNPILDQLALSADGSRRTEASKLAAAGHTGTLTPGRTTTVEVDPPMSTGALADKKRAAAEKLGARVREVMLAEGIGVSGDSRGVREVRIPRSARLGGNHVTDTDDYHVIRPVPSGRRDPSDRRMAKVASNPDGSITVQWRQDLGQGTDDVNLMGSDGIVRVTLPAGSWKMGDPRSSTPDTPAPDADAPRVSDKVRDRMNDAYAAGDGRIEVNTRTDGRGVPGSLTRAEADDLVEKGLAKRDGDGAVKLLRDRDGKLYPLSDAEYDVYAKDLQARIDAATAEGRTTDKLHGVEYTMDNGKTGVLWNADREALHNEIVEDVWQRMFAHVPNEGKAIFSGGLGGAGKGTALKKLPGDVKRNYATIDPDGMKEELAKRGMVPEVEGMDPMEGAGLIHEESSHLAGLIAARAIRERKNLIYDTTMAKAKSVTSKMDELEAAGYEPPRAIFVEVPIEVSVSRALSRHKNGLERARNGEGLGGRYVPVNIIRSHATDGPANSKNREAFDEVRNRFGEWAIYDNSVNGRDSVLLLDSNGDGIGEQYGNPEGWERYQADAVEDLLAEEGQGVLNDSPRLGPDGRVLPDEQQPVRVLEARAARAAGTAGSTGSNPGAGQAGGTGTNPGAGQLADPGAMGSLGGEPGPRLGDDPSDVIGGGAAPFDLGQVRGAYQGAKVASPFDMPQPVIDRTNDLETQRQAALKENGTWDHGLFGADPILGAIAAEQGFDALPRVTDRAGVDDVVAAGGIEIFRGIHDTPNSQGADMAEQFRSGELFTGLGVNGSGTYTAIRPDTAEGFASGNGGEGAMMRMALVPGARIIKQSEVHKEYAAYNRQLWTAAGRKFPWFPSEHPWRGMSANDGRMAAAMGYDAIYVDRTPESGFLGGAGLAGLGGDDSHYVVLNRSAVVVQDTDPRGEDFDPVGKRYEAGVVVSDNPPTWERYRNG